MYVPPPPVPAPPPNIAAIVGSIAGVILGVTFLVLMIVLYRKGVCSKLKTKLLNIKRRNLTKINESTGKVITLKSINPAERDLPPAIHHKQPIVVTPARKKSTQRCCDWLCCRKKSEPTTEAEED